MQDYRVQTFLTVCRTMNYTRAAEELRITQPAVSQHIAFLERRYGAPLFAYRRKKLELTPAGELLRDALSVMAHDDRLLRDRIAHLGGAQVQIVVGMTLTAGEYVVAAPLADCLAASPHLDVTIRSGGTAQLVSQLDAGAVDCAFVEGFFNKSTYAWDVFCTERLVCVCAPDNSLARGTHRIEDVLDQRLLVRESGSGTRAVLEHALAARNLSMEAFGCINVVESLDVIKVLVARGLGVSFLYEAAVKRELASGELKAVQLEDFSVRHDITFIRLKGSVFEPEFKSLFASLLAACPR